MTAMIAWACGWGVAVAVGGYVWLVPQLAVQFFKINLQPRAVLGRLEQRMSLVFFFVFFFRSFFVFFELGCFVFPWAVGRGSADG